MPDTLVEARSRELWEQMLHSLSHQGIDKQTYLQISGREEDEIVEAGKEDAAQALRREAVLAAIVEAEGIEPTEEELLEAVGAATGGGDEQVSPKKLLERLKSAGRLDALKEDLAQRRRWTSSPSRPSRSRRAGAGPRQAVDARARDRGRALRRRASGRRGHRPRPTGSDGDCPLLDSRRVRGCGRR